MRKIITNYAKVVNDKTGEIETVSVEILENKQYKIKGGWCRVYRFKLDDVLREITSKTEYDIYAIIRDSNFHKTFALNFNQTKIAKELNVSRVTVARVVSKLKDKQFIKKIDNVYFINPFIYIPPFIDNETISETQQLWKEQDKESHE